MVYRLVGTLAEHGLVRRDDAGRLRLGAGVLQLARRAQPLLADAATAGRCAGSPKTVGATAHLTIAEGAEAVALLVVEPTWTQFHVAYRPGRAIRWTAARPAGRSWPVAPAMPGTCRQPASCNRARTAWRPRCWASRGWRPASAWWPWPPWTSPTVGPAVVAAAASVATALS